MREIFIEPFYNGWEGIIIGILIWILAVFLFVLIGYGIYYLIDSSNLEFKNGVGLITNKFFTPYHTTTIFVMSGKVLVPIIQHHPDTYEFLIKINGLNDLIEVSHEQYLSLDINDKVECIYKLGRFSDSLYIESIRP
jgi:hypothetical protein